MGENMTELEKAEAAQAAFKQSMRESHPWLPGSSFRSNPGLDLYIQAALESWVHAKREAEQWKLAQSLMEASREGSNGEE
jgi:hypothetical protein